MSGPVNGWLRTPRWRRPAPVIALVLLALGLAAWVWWNTNWGLYLLRGRVLVRLSDHELSKGDLEKADDYMSRLLDAKPGIAIAESEILKLDDRGRRHRLWLQLQRLSRFEDQRVRFGRRAAEDTPGEEGPGAR